MGKPAATLPSDPARSTWNGPPQRENALPSGGGVTGAWPGRPVTGTWPGRPAAAHQHLAQVTRPPEPRPAPAVLDPWMAALQHPVESHQVAAQLAALRSDVREVAVDNELIQHLLAQRRRDRRAGDEEAIVQMLAGLNPAGFRDLIADLFRRESYEVNAGQGPDADVIDLVVTKHGEDWLVNCQLRSVGSVDLAALIEMSKVIKHNNADGAFIISDGEFGHDCRAFARTNGMILIDRELLLNMVVEFTLEDLRKENVGLKLSKLMHPERGHELRHALLSGEIGRPQKRTKH